jgi:hypothetical protein
MRLGMLGAVALIGCAARGAPGAGPVSAGSAGIDGIYWVAEGFDGPPTARVEIDGGELTIRPVGGAPSIAMRISPDGDEYEARADNGAILLFRPRPDGGLSVVAPDARVAVGYRVGALPPDLVGGWVFRAFDGPERRALVVAREAGRPSLLTVDLTTTWEVWPLVRPDVAAAWVRVGPSGDAVIEQIVPRPGGARVLQAAGAAPWILHRDGDRPTWLPPAP